MSLERVVVTIGGKPFLPWWAVSIDVSVEMAARTASLTAHLPVGMVPPMPDLPATVTANGTLLLTGFVRDFRPQQGEGNWSADVTLISKTTDAVDASILHPTGLAKNKNLKALAEEFDSCGCGVEAEGEFEEIERHQITPGDSLFDTLEPLARSEGAIITDTPEGKLKLANKPGKQHAGGLAAGVNIISGSADFSGAEKFDPVKVRGQQARGAGKDALRGEATVRDPSIGRVRPKIVILEADGTKQRLSKRAEWQARRMAGAGTTASFEVSGWRDAAGEVWTPNRLVYVRHPRLFLDQMMVIKSVTLSQDTSEGGTGTRASLTLADPRALGGKASKSKSDKAWAAPEPKAEYSAQ